MNKEELCMWLLKKAEDLEDGNETEDEVHSLLYLAAMNVSSDDMREFLDHCMNYVYVKHAELLAFDEIMHSYSDRLN
jgi:hypothetical protein